MFVIYTLISNHLLCIVLFEVNELHHSLHEADQAMSENEQLLSDYRLANARQSLEMDEVRMYLCVHMT